MFEILAGVAGAVSAAVAAGVAVVHARRRRRQKIFVAVVEQLDLEPGQAPLVAHGFFRERPVSVQLIYHGGKKFYTYQSKVTCTFDCWLDLQFHVLHRRHQHRWGDFDDDFQVIEKRSTDRVSPLITDGLKRLLHEHFFTFIAFDLRGDRLEVEAGLTAIDERQIHTSCVLASELAAQIENGWCAVPVTPELAEHVAPWTGFSRAHGLELTTVPLGLAGRFNDIRVCAWAIPTEFYKESETEGNDYWLEVAAMFPEGLGLDFTIGTRQVVGKLPTKENTDRADEDATFDALFRIEGQPPEASGVLVPAELRTELQALSRDLPTIMLNDQRLRARFNRVPLEPKRVLTVMQRLAESARIIAEICSRGTDQRRGPYR